MRNLITLLLLGVSISLFSCNGDGKAKNSTEESATTNSSAALSTASNQQFNVNSAALQKDFNTWWSYTYNNVKLSEDFVGLDADSNIIKKSDFLQQLTSGHFVPFKIMVRNNVPYYKLYPVSNSRSDIKETIKQVTAAEIVHFNKEGQSLPAFNFTDITGKTYTPATTKGKVMVLKCWFIGCVPCVQEFPEVNKLVEGYKDRNDILFISLAIDKKSHLVNFLKAHDLKYATMPDMGDYMHDKLGIGSYPTHLLIDRAGKIVKVVNRIDELKPFLDKQAATSL